MIESLYPLLATLVGVLAFVAIGRLARSQRTSRDRAARGPTSAPREPIVAATGRTDRVEGAAPFERWLARARHAAPSGSADASTDRSQRDGATRRPRAIATPPPIAGLAPAVVVA